MPAPAIRPRFIPRLNPCGSDSSRRARTERWSSRCSSRLSSSVSSSSSPTWRLGITIRCPGLYGYLFNTTNASSERASTRSESSPSRRRQRTQPAPSGSSLFAWMYSIRQGLQSVSIPLGGEVALGERAGSSLVGQRSDDPLERHAGVLLPAAIPHGEGAGLDVPVADDHHVRRLHQLR